jgi:metal-sulfur cluster biosynthetic enzyme
MLNDEIIGDAGSLPTEADATNSPADDTAPAAGSADSGDFATEQQVRAVLRRVKDPELALNIVDLGLVYDVSVEGTTVHVDMTLTSPGCPSGAEIMGDAERELKTMPGVGEVEINLVWSPFWSPERIEPRVRAYLGF